MNSNPAPIILVPPSALTVMAVGLFLIFCTLLLGWRLTRTMHPTTRWAILGCTTLLLFLCTFASTLAVQAYHNARDPRWQPQAEPAPMAVETQAAQSISVSETMSAEDSEEGFRGELPAASQNPAAPQHPASSPDSAAKP